MSNINTDALAAMSVLDSGYKNNFYSWLTEQVVTVDETMRKHRRFPDKPFLEDVAHALTVEPRLAFPKSRRMLMTWILCSYCCWSARYVSGHFIAWQSETFTKAAFALGPQRMSFIENNLKTRGLRKRYDKLEAKGGYERVKYKHKWVEPDGRIADGESTVIATAQGATVLNAYTPSIIVLDESELQPYARETLAHALPLLESGVQMIICSSSGGPSGILAEMARSVNFFRFT